MKTIFASIPNLVLEYKAHDASMKDNSSFRNADQSLSFLYQKGQSAPKKDKRELYSRDSKEVRETRDKKISEKIGQGFT